MPTTKCTVTLHTSRFTPGFTHLSSSFRRDQPDHQRNYRIRFYARFQWLHVSTWIRTYLWLCQMWPIIRNTLCVVARASRYMQPAVRLAGNILIWTGCVYSGMVRCCFRRTRVTLIVNVWLMLQVYSWAVSFRDRTVLRINFPPMGSSG